MRDAVGDAVITEDAHGISADAEICGVTEADEPPISEDQVEAERGNREYHDAREEADVEGRFGHGRNRRNQRQRGKRDKNRATSAAHQRPTFRDPGAETGPAAARTIPPPSGCRSASTRAPGRISPPRCRP